VIRRCSAPFDWSACRAGRLRRGRERENTRRSNPPPRVFALSSPARRVRRPVERRFSASAPHRASVRGGDPAPPRSLRVPVTGESVESRCSIVLSLFLRGAVARMPQTPRKLCAGKEGSRGLQHRETEKRMLGALRSSVSLCESVASVSSVIDGREVQSKWKQAGAPEGRNVSGALPAESALWAPSTGTC
jgi:hypothetical protein